MAEAYGGRAEAGMPRRGQAAPPAASGAAFSGKNAPQNTQRGGEPEAEGPPDRPRSEKKETLIVVVVGSRSGVVG